MGSEFDDVDWQKLDPRQYDPRRIIKEALLDDIEDAIKPLSEGAPKPVVKPSPAAAAGPPAVAAAPQLADGQRAPFDVEAT